MVIYMKKNSKPLILGTEVFSGDWGIIFTKKMIEKILICFNDLECNEIDTAPSYGKSNYVEKILGQVVKENQNTKFKISSKFIFNSIEKKNIKNLIKKIENQLDNSLMNLNVDAIDTYYFHSGTNEFFFIDEVWEYLNNRKKRGDINHLGLSMKHQLVENNDLKQVYNLNNYGITKVQTVLNLFSKHSLNELIPFCNANQITVYGRMPLAKGLLSGKYGNKNSLNTNDPRKNNEFTDKIIKFKLENKDLDLEKVIKWPLKYVRKIIFGVKNPNQLEEIANIFK